MTHVLTISNLPAELLLEIFTYLSPQELAAVARVCRLWRLLADDNSLWVGHALKQRWMPRARANSCDSPSRHAPAADVASWKLHYRARERLVAKWAHAEYQLFQLRGHATRVHSVHFDTSHLLSASSSELVVRPSPVPSTGGADSSRLLASWKRDDVILCASLGQAHVHCGTRAGLFRYELPLASSPTGSLSGVVRGLLASDEPRTAVEQLRMYEDEVCFALGDGRLRLIDVQGGGRTVWQRASGEDCVMDWDGLTTGVSSCGSLVQLWDLRARPDCVLLFEAHGARVTDLQLSLAFAEPRRWAREHTVRLVTGAANGQLRSWDIRNCSRPLRTFDGHASAVFGVRHTDALVASCSHDKTLRVWDLESGECLRTVPASTYSRRAPQLDDDVLVCGLGTQVEVRTFGATRSPKRSLQL